MKALAPDGTVIGWDESGSGRPVCLVHGGAADSAIWSGVRALLPDGLRVAAMDRRGRGRSGRGDDERYSLEVEADDILCVAEALGGGIVVVAHSIAATITLQALRRADGLITGAVLYEPPLPGMESGLGSAQAMLAALEEGRDEDALVAFMANMVRMPAEDIAAYQASPVWASRVSMIWTMRRESSALAALDPDVARYSIIPGPVRFLVGSRTASHQAEAVSALANVVPNAAITTLDNQGHGAIVLAPGLVASAISDFLREVDLPSRRFAAAATTATGPWATRDTSGPFSQAGIVDR